MIIGELHVVIENHIALCTDFYWDALLYLLKMMLSQIS
jgi:hypothetical protein